MESLFDLIWGEETLGGQMPGDPPPMTESCMICLCRPGPLPGSGNSGGIQFPSFRTFCKDEA